MVQSVAAAITCWRCAPGAETSSVSTTRKRKPELAWPFTEMCVNVSRFSHTIINVIMLGIIIVIYPHSTQESDSFLQSLEQGLEHSRCSGNTCEVNE